jgi:predicted TIM-barrel fold metal-dependent hydrolase
MATRPQVIALEEHYLDPEVKPYITGSDVTRQPNVSARLDDVGQGRIAEMDAAGIDIQVLSHGAPSVQRLEAELAVRLARGANDRLAETVRSHPDRFAGFAMLPTADPEAAADELERAVTRLGFKGAMVHGLTGGLFLDDKRFWPIFERAQALDVPLYMHPAVPHPAVIDVYYKDYVEKYPNILRAAWGFTVETATQGIRLVLSGVFDTYPGLKIILGHLGAGAGRGRAELVPRHIPRAFLDHDERVLLRSGTPLLHDGDGGRPHPVLNRLSVCREPARHRLGAPHPVMRRGQGKNSQRQHQAPVEALTQNI